jgi:hypothetical protein
MTLTGNTPPPLAPPSTEAVHRLVDSELSLHSRLGYLAVLLGASMMTAVIAALWLTEPALPLRTQLAFAAMTVIGLSWVVFAMWALRRRRPLFAPQAIVAGRMALTFTSVFVLGALGVAATAGGRAPYAAAAAGVLMMMAAAALLRRAHRREARLTERRGTLERELGRHAS